MRNVASGSVIVLAICLCFSVVACASTGVRNVTPTGSEGWRAVIELRRGTDISVMVDCTGGRAHEACTSSRLPQGDSPPIRAITAKHVEADAESLLVRPDYEDTTVLQVPRAMVIIVYVADLKSNLKGMLFGLGIGMGFYGIFGLPAKDDLTILGNLLFAGIFGGGGAGIGYAMDRGSGPPITWVRVYQRADPATKARPWPGRVARIR